MDNYIITRLSWGFGIVSSLKYSYIEQINDTTSFINKIYAPTTVGNAGQILQSNGSSAPTWVTPNYATLDDVNNAINGAWEDSY
jgi:hypothetical protein